MSSSDAPVPVSSLPGGLDLARVAIERALVTTTIKQMRLADVLDAIGPPSQAQCDAEAGTITLRGKTFGAEPLGTYDGTVWRWAWASEPAFAEAHTTLARGARASAERIDAILLQTPAIDLEGVLPMGDVVSLAVGHGFGDAFFVADMDERQVVFALMPGQLTPRWDRLEELNRAITSVLLASPGESIALAARYLGLKVEASGQEIIVRDGADTLKARLVKGKIDQVEWAAKV
jgi:uncharacterized protein DUF6882